MSQLTKILLIVVLMAFVFFLMDAVQEFTDYSKAGDSFNILLFFVSLYLIRAIWLTKTPREKCNNRKRY